MFGTVSVCQLSHRNHKRTGGGNGDSIDQACVCDGNVQLADDIGQQHVHNAHIDGNQWHAGDQKPEARPKRPGCGWLVRHEILRNEAAVTGVS